MEWTKEKPKKEGYYWFYVPGKNEDMQIVGLIDWGIGLYVNVMGADELTEALANWEEGYWMGPIKEPQLSLG